MDLTWNFKVPVSKFMRIPNFPKECDRTLQCCATLLKILRLFGIKSYKKQRHPLRKYASIPHLCRHSTPHGFRPTLTAASHAGMMCQRASMVMEPFLFTAIKKFKIFFVCISCKGKVGLPVCCIRSHHQQV